MFLRYLSPFFIRSETLKFPPLNFLVLAFKVLLNSTLETGCNPLIILITFEYASVIIDELGIENGNIYWINKRYNPKDPKDYDTIYVPESVLSDIRWYIKRRKETKPIVHMEHGNSRYMIDNTKRDNPRVIGEETIPDSITGLYERIKYEK